MTAEECLWHLDREVDRLRACRPLTSHEQDELKRIIERLLDVYAPEYEVDAA